MNEIPLVERPERKMTRKLTLRKLSPRLSGKVEPELLATCTYCRHSYKVPQGCCTARYNPGLERLSSAVQPHEGLTASSLSVELLYSSISFSMLLCKARNL